MKIHESSWDSIIRVFSGFFLLYLGLGSELPGFLALLADVLGLFLLLTELLAFVRYTLFLDGKNKLSLKRSFAVDVQARRIRYGYSHLF